MFQRKPRRFRRRSNDRNDRMGFSHGGDKGHGRLRSNSFSNGHGRNKFKPTLSAEKLLDKYNTLAKEAMSSGDKTLAENYLQHADHFMRIIDDKNRNQSQSKPNLIHKTEPEAKPLSKENNIQQDQVTDNSNNKE